MAGKARRRCAWSGVGTEEGDLTFISLLRPKFAEFILRRHPDIVRFLDSGSDQGTFFFCRTRL